VPTLSFIAGVIRDEGITDLALRVSKQIRLTNLNRKFVQAARFAPTLRVALEAFCRMAHLDDSSVCFWMARNGEGFKICSLINLPADDKALQCSEWTNQMGVLEIIRAFAGPGWSPEEMAFRFDASVEGAAENAFPNTRLVTDQKAAWISVPKNVLALGPFPKGPLQSSSPKSMELREMDIFAPTDFPFSLKAVLKSYLCDGYPEIRLAARLADTSVRSLQRSLACAETTYSEVVEAARFEVAAELLEDPDHKIIDVALAVGFDDPSHFARAFRRVSGLTPRQFRTSRTQQWHAA
jgi:AraC-like DNA-binding protein